MKIKAGKNNDYENNGKIEKKRHKYRENNLK